MLSIPLPLTRAMKWHDMAWQGAEQRRQVHRAIMDANPPHIQAVFSPSQVGMMRGSMRMQCRSSSLIMYIQESQLRHPISLLVMEALVIYISVQIDCDLQVAQ